MAALWRLLNLMQHEVCTRTDTLQWCDLPNEFYERLSSSHLDIQILEDDIMLPRNVLIRLFGEDIITEGWISRLHPSRNLETGSAF